MLLVLEDLRWSRSEHLTIAKLSRCSVRVSFAAARGADLALNL